MVEDFFETEEEEETQLAAPPAQFAFQAPAGFRSNFGGTTESNGTPSPSVGRGSHMNRPAWMVDN